VIVRFVLLAAALAAAAPAAALLHEPEPEPEDLSPALAAIARETAAEFAAVGLTEEGLSISLRELARPSGEPRHGGFRGDVPQYPASVVKIFFLAYAAAREDAGKLKVTPELERALQDMIHVSSNDATGYVLDVLTGTTSGPELTGAEWERWKQKRNAVNRFFASRGYGESLNANQKTFCEDAYGREQAFRDGGKNRNRMSSDDAARLLGEIATGRLAGPAGTQTMLARLERDVSSEVRLDDLELEDARLAGRRLPAGTRVWAKSGDAYDSHHLVARLLLPDGHDVVLAVFTRGVRANMDVIPRVFEKVGALYAAAAPTGSGGR
jgi:beta-lactamase class A